jgi:hypothetical protein
VEVLGESEEAIGGVFDVFIVQNGGFGETEDCDPFYRLHFQFMFFGHIRGHTVFLFDMYSPPTVYQDTILRGGWQIKRKYSIAGN